MKHSTVSRIKLFTAVFSLIAVSFYSYGCAGITPAQITTAETLANYAASAVATYYGGPVAGQLASAGLSAVATVLQGYIGHNVPAAIVEASPGIAGVGQAVLQHYVTTGTITQTTVDTIHSAAAIAATITAADVKK